jgi:hypothetical protein
MRNDARRDSRLTKGRFRVRIKQNGHTRTFRYSAERRSIADGLLIARLAMAVKG